MQDYLSVAVLLFVAAPQVRGQCNCNTLETCVTDRALQRTLVMAQCRENCSASLGAQARPVIQCYTTKDQQKTVLNQQLRQCMLRNSGVCTAGTATGTGTTGQRVPTNSNSNRQSTWENFFGGRGTNQRGRRDVRRGGGRGGGFNVGVDQFGVNNGIRRQSLPPQLTTFNDCVSRCTATQTTVLGLSDRGYQVPQNGRGNSWNNFNNNQNQRGPRGRRQTGDCGTNRDLQDCAVQQTGCSINSATTRTAQTTCNTQIGTNVFTQLSQQTCECLRTALGVSATDLPCTTTSIGASRSRGGAFFDDSGSTFTVGQVALDGEIDPDFEADFAT